MEVIKNIAVGFAYGLWDSVCGMRFVLYIDDEIHKLNLEKEAENYKRMQERRGIVRRTPSPVPSSASAMDRQEQGALAATRRIRENPDERRLDAIIKKPVPKPTKDQKEPKSEKKIAKQVAQCCALNGGFTWLSIIFFECLVLPALRHMFCKFGTPEKYFHIWEDVQSWLSLFFSAMWVVPIFILSKIVSSLWFADIANAAFRVRKGKPKMIPGISKLVADFLFSLVVQALYLGQSMLLQLLPISFLGDILYYIHICFLYSLYAFEYKWLNMGWELPRRLNYIEENWPYFLGFGLPLTIATSCTDSVIVSGCIFSIFFPLFILSGNEAKPTVGTTDTPLRFFGPIIIFTNFCFGRRSTATSAAAQLTASIEAAQKQQLLQEQQQQKRMLQQQLVEHNMRHHSRSRDDYTITAAAGNPTTVHRYPQPPQLRPAAQVYRKATTNSQKSTPVKLRLGSVGSGIGGGNNVFDIDYDRDGASSSYHFSTNSMRRPLIPTPVSAPRAGGKL